jgi:hypothetical protein
MVDIDSEKSKNYSDFVKETLTYWAENSTIHSINHILKARLILKVFWLILFFVCFFYCSYQIVVTAVKFAKYETLSSTSTVLKDSLEFPAVDFCNLNGINYHGSALMIPQTLGPVEDELKHAYSDSPIAYNYAAGELIRSAIAGADFLLDIGPDVGFNLDQMILSCSFNSEKCTKDDFYYYFNYYYGSCYRFNGGKTKVMVGLPVLTYRSAIVNWNESVASIKSVSKNGPDYGLQLELFTDSTEITNDVNYTRFNSKSGIRLLVHHPDETEVYPNEDGLDVSTGQETNIAISKRIVKKLSSPYSSCRTKLTKQNVGNNQILIDMLNIFGFDKKNYEQKFCIKLCEQHYYKSNCECYYSNLPMDEVSISNFFNEHINEYENDYLTFSNETRITVPCLNSNQLKCVTLNKRTIYESDEFSKCISKCDGNCITNEFDYDLSFAAYPTKTYSDQLQDSGIFEYVLMNNYPLNKTTPAGPSSGSYTYESIQRPIDDKVMRDSVLKVNVYYKEMVLTETSETPAMTSDTLLSAIGGNLGLFLGASVISCTEIFLLLLKLIKGLFSKKFKNDVSNSNE